MNRTKDYNIFKDFSSNREVDPKHVKKLVRAISSRNLLPVNPIIVSNDMKVIDGQHRLEAAKTLGVEIYYIQGEINRKDISRLNSNQKNWNTMDYINFYTIEGVKEFIEFSKLVNHFPKVKVSAMLSLVNEETKRNAAELKQGILNILDIDIAQKVCELCYQLNETYEYTFVFDSRFPVALKKAIQSEGFKLENLLSKIQASPRSFVACHNIDEYCKMIEDVYNYRVKINQLRINGKK